MAPTQPEFIDAVLLKLGLTQTRLADDLERGGGSRYQAGHRLKKGGSDLRYEDTMELLERCGWLNEAKLAKAVEEAKLAAEKGGRHAARGEAKANALPKPEKK